MGNLCNGQSPRPMAALSTIDEMGPTPLPPETPNFLTSVKISKTYIGTGTPRTGRDCLRMNCSGRGVFACLLVAEV